MPSPRVGTKMTSSVKRIRRILAPFLDSRERSHTEKQKVEALGTVHSTCRRCRALGVQTMIRKKKEKDKISS